MATALCVSNLYFARHSGYFAPDASTKPLHHTWSLAVEEQFYLLYPVGLLLLLRLGASQRTIILVLAGIALASLGLASAGGVLFPTYAFYILPTRAWELMIGALVAFAPALGPPLFRQALSVVAVTLIAIGIAGVRLTASDIVPAPLLSCIGAAILIYANSGAGTIFNRILSNPGVVALGLISYSLYLWHWPTIVIYRYAFGNTLHPSDVAIILLFTLAAASASWFFVEQPIRKRRILVGKGSVYLMAVSSSVGLIGLSYIAIANLGFPARLPPDVLQLANGRFDTNLSLERCIGKEPDNALSGAFCQIGSKKTPPTFIVWGDSHADLWMPIFHDVALQHAASGLVAAHAGCPPILDIKIVNAPPSHRCTEFNKAVLAKAESIQVKDIVLIARWSWYIYGVEKDGSETGDGQIIAKTGDSNEGAGDITRRKRVFREGIAETVAHLAKDGANVWIIDQPPTYPEDVPKYLAYAAWRGEDIVGRSREYIQQRHKFQLDVFRENKVNLVDTTSFFCPAEQSNCIMQKDGKSLYSDYNHLSVFGARETAEWAGRGFFSPHLPPPPSRPKS